jgi:P-type Ca2+ transporter type 2C
MLSLLSSATDARIHEVDFPKTRDSARLRVVKLFAVLGGGVSVLAVLLYGIMRGGWLDAVLAGIASV